MVEHTGSAGIPLRRASGVAVSLSHSLALEEEPVHHERPEAACGNHVRVL